MNAALAQPANIVELLGVQKRYGSVCALASLDLTLQSGEMLGLFGHNGAGKTTAIKLMLGLIKPSGGQLRVFGQNPGKSAGRNLRRNLGFLPENVTLYEQLSGGEVLRYFARLKGISPRQCAAALEEVGLAHAAKQRVKTYSKGMRQRLGLAQALLGEPKLLLLDEPTVGLDPIATQDFYQRLARLKQRGSTIVLCSHVLPGVEKYIDRALILCQGQCLAQGSVDDLRQQAALPLLLNLQGTDMQIPERWAQAAEPCSNGLTIQLPLQHKLAAIHELSALVGLRDMDVQMPSLEDLYRYFMRQKTARADHALGAC